MLDEIPESWLAAFNARMSEEGVPHIRRPNLALWEWARTCSFGISVGSPAEQRVLDWFKERSPEGTFLVPPVYESVFYVDSAFWPMRVPRVYGTAPFDVFDCLDIPVAVRQRAFSREDVARRYKAMFADAFDYSYGLDDIREHYPPDGGGALLASAGQQLSAASSLLLERAPNPKAMESSRMAVEMFVKSFLCIHHGFDEKNARRLNHDLSDALRAVLERAPHSEFQRLGRRLAIFPPIGERYSGRAYSNEDLFEAYCTALAAGACVVRSISTRNLRTSLGV